MRVKDRFLLAAVVCLLLILLAGQGAAEYRTLAVGMQGEDVRAFKEALYWLGYFGTSNLSDQYTDQTAEKVRLFQKNNGLAETGQADADLQALAFSAV